MLSDDPFIVSKLLRVIKSINSRNVKLNIGNVKYIASKSYLDKHAYMLEYICRKATSCRIVVRPTAAPFSAAAFYLKAVQRQRR